jgi:hypothetical protein
VEQACVSGSRHSPVSLLHPEQTVSERVAGARRTKRNRRLACTLTITATQEVVPCSNGTGSRHVSSFPRQWRRRPPRNRIRAAAEEDREEEEDRRRHALQGPRRRQHPHVRGRPRTPRRRRVPRPLRKLQRRDPRRGLPHRGRRHRKLPLRVLHRKRPRREHPPRALRRSTLFAHLKDLPPERGTRPRRRPRRLPRNGSRKPPGAAAAIEDELPNRHRVKT